MSSMQYNSYSTLIRQQVKRSFERLTSAMDEVSDPEIIEHCRIWQDENGIRTLVAVALDGDRFLNTKEAKAKKQKLEHQKIEKIKENTDLKTSKQKKPKRKIRKTNKAVKIDKEKQQSEQKQCLLKKEQANQQDKQLLNSQKEQIQCQIQLKKQQQSIDAIRIKREEELENQMHFFSPQEDQDINFITKRNSTCKKGYLRGPYVKYTKQMKEKMVQLYKSNTISISRISSQYGVPIKNIKRWAEHGVERKQGAGRKRMDPFMESDLLKNIKQKYPIGSTLVLEDIRLLALKLSRISDFKASKGWLLSFVERFQLSKLYTIV